VMVATLLLNWDLRALIVSIVCKVPCLYYLKPRIPRQRVREPQKPRRFARDLKFEIVVEFDCAMFRVYASLKARTRDIKLGAIKDRLMSRLPGYEYMPS
jgi:hypothetical protein